MPRHGSAQPPRPAAALAPAPGRQPPGRRLRPAAAEVALRDCGAGAPAAVAKAAVDQAQSWLSQPPRPAAALARGPGRQATYGHCASRPLPREREHHHREHHHPMAFCQSRYSCTPGHEAKPQPLATYHCAMSGDFLPIESQTGSVAAGNVYIPRHSVVGQFGCYSFAKDTSISARRCSRNATSSSLRPW